MNTVEIEAALTSALDGVHLLDHAFYQRWSRGELSGTELTDYASQYRHFEATLPSVLRQIIEQLPDGKAREFVGQNLADETGDPTHLELFDSFLDAVGGERSAEPSAAMSALLDAYGDLGQVGPIAGLGGLIAYESQSSGVATSKGIGLREHYGLDSVATRFWDVHAELDLDHSDWAFEAIGEVVTDDAELRQASGATRRIAEAWWSFLDEREALAEKAATA